MNELTFHIGGIRPPNESSSLLLQVTKGCTWNQCRFCRLYKDIPFEAYSEAQLKQDVDNMRVLADRILSYRIGEGRTGWDIPGLNAALKKCRSTEEKNCFAMLANWLISDGENVFLQDGNSIVLRDGRLSNVILYLREAFPQIKRVTSYGRAENLSRLSAADYAELKEAGLDRIHSGFESGADSVLAYIHKGATQEQEIRAGKNVKAGGIELCIYFMAGVGGRPLSAEHAEETAHVISETDPESLRIRTFAPKEGTPLYDDWMSGKHISCTEDDRILEIRRIIECVSGVDTRIYSDHIDNLLERVEGHIVNDREKLLAIIDEYLALPEEEKRRFQLARRMGMVSSLNDLKYMVSEQKQQLEDLRAQIPPEHWEDTMTGLFARYV